MVYIMFIYQYTKGKSFKLSLPFYTNSLALTVSTPCYRLFSSKKLQFAEDWPDITGRKL